ncbi:MAG TPA: hypothetical protein V6D17_09110 [Candidatus Obscuribacterales bacterium]
MKERTPKKKDPVVYALSKASRCYNCDSKLLPDDIVKIATGKDEREVLCQKCAGLEDFAILPAGNAQLTRTASKHSQTRYVVMKWSELWKCYERKGLLVEREALAQAQRDILSEKD